LKVATLNGTRPQQKDWLIRLLLMSNLDLYHASLWSTASPPCPTFPSSCLIFSIHLLPRARVLFISLRICTAASLTNAQNPRTVPGTPLQAIYELL
jgi:hypothetical protein